MKRIKRFLLLVAGFAIGCGADSGSQTQYKETKTEGHVKVLGQEVSFQRTNREPVTGGDSGKKP